MIIDELFKEKNSKLLQFNEMRKIQFRGTSEERNKFNQEKFISLANEVADLEKQISEYLIDNKEFEKVGVNLISQASCLVIAGKIKEANEIYQKSLNYVNHLQLRNWVLNEIKFLVEQE